MFSMLKFIFSYPEDESNDFTLLGETAPTSMGNIGHQSRVSRRMELGFTHSKFKCRSIGLSVEMLSSK